MFLDRRQGTKDSGLNGTKHSRNLFRS